MKKTYKEFQEQVLEKTLSPDDINDLIDKSIEGVTAIKNDKKRNKEDVSTAKSVLKWLQGVRATFEKEGSLHPSTVLSIMKTVAGVSSGRYGYMVPGWKSSPQGKVPKDFSNEERTIISFASMISVVIFMYIEFLISTVIFSNPI